MFIHLISVWYCIMGETLKLITAENLCLTRRTFMLAHATHGGPAEHWDNQWWTQSHRHLVHSHFDCVPQALCWHRALSFHHFQFPAGKLGFLTALTSVWSTIFWLYGVENMIQFLLNAFSLTDCWMSSTESVCLYPSRTIIVYYY